MRFQCSHCHGILAIDGCEPGEAVACGHCHSAVAVPETRTSPGAVINDFVIRDRIGEGGMGVVYLAHQISLDRVAALKILHSQFSADSSYINDFIREARAAAAINHPSIVQAYAVGEEDGIYFFAMEYIEGSTLKQVLVHGGRLVPDRAMVIAEQMALALQHAWESQELVHRDIKPDNIILTSTGKIKLADLGLARRSSDVPGEDPDALYGTPQYIAPEQLLGHPGNNQSDIYSLGATLYHALTGRFPYQGSSATEIAQKHLTDALEPPESIVAGIPPEISTLVQTMMAKRPGHRYTDAAELCDDIALASRGQAPLRPLAQCSQDPITIITEDDPLSALAIDSADDANAAEAVVPPETPETPETPEPRAKGSRKGRKKLSMRGGRKRGGTTSAGTALDVDAGADASPDDPDDDGDDPAPAEGPAKSSSRKGILVGCLVVVAVVLLCTGGGLFYFYKIARRAVEEAVANGNLTVTAGGGELASAAEELREMAASGQSSDAILGRAAAVLSTQGDPNAAYAQLSDAIAPAVEGELLALRQPLIDSEREQWALRAETLRQQADEQTEAEAEAERQRLERERMAREKAAREAARRKALAELQKQQAEVRWDMVEACRTHEYTASLRPLVALRKSPNPDARAWGDRKARAIALAKELFGLIYNTKEKLAGVELPVSGHRKPWRVTSLDSRYVHIEQRKVRIVDGQNQEEMLREHRPYEALSGPQVYALASAARQKDGVSPAEFSLKFAAFLIARAEYINTACDHLKNAGDDEIVSLLEEEADALRPLRIDELVEQLRTAFANNNRAMAQAAYAHLKLNYPEQFDARQEEIRAIVGGN